jgi:ParB/RepB/Spo0J family partition protein
MASPIKKYPFTFKELPLGKVEQDPDQPRKDFGTDDDENRLLLSIEEYGIQQPLVVSEVSDGRYIILDGHRRYICAQKLKFESVPCRVYKKLPEGLFETFRYEIQNNRRPWKPLERAESLKTIKEAMRFENNKQLAQHIHLSEASVSNSIQLAKEKTTFLEMMVRHGLSEAYQVEFIHLKAKLRRIKNLEVVDITKLLFEKVQNHVIRSAKDFRKFGKIFSRATANEAEIYKFLTDPDMTVNELSQRTVQSGRSLLIEQLIRELAGTRQKGVSFSSQEKTSLKHLSELLGKVL